MAKDGELTVSVSLNRKDSTLTIKAETDSIVPKVMMETTETVARKTLESEWEEKPPDKAVGKTIGILCFMGFMLAAFVIWLDWRKLKDYLKEDKENG